MQSLARDISPSLVHARALRGVLRALSVRARFDVHAGLRLAVRAYMRVHTVELTSTEPLSVPAPWTLRSCEQHRRSC